MSVFKFFSLGELFLLGKGMHKIQTSLSVLRLYNSILGRKDVGQNNAIDLLVVYDQKGIFFRIVPFILLVYLGPAAWPAGRPTG